MTGQLVMSEAAFQKRVTDYCTLLGLTWFHSGDSRRDSGAGFPDLVIAGKRVVYAELKRENGRVAPEQRAWLMKLRDAGAEVHVWRPSQWPLIAARLRVLAGRP